MMPSRRAVLAAPALVAASSIFGGARAQSELESSVVIRTSGGAFEAALKKNFFEPFTKASGVRVIPIAASDSEMQARMAAMSAAGRVEWDIVSPQYDELPNLARYLVDLADCGVLPAVGGEGVAGTCGRYGILYVIGAQVLAYNTTAFPEGKGPQTWADFWDVQKFPGRRGLSNSGGPWATLVSALIADGVEPSKLFPLDLDRAFRKLDEIKPHIAVWWRTGDQSQQIFRSGEVQMALMWSGRAFASKRQGVPLAWNYDKTFANFGAWAMLKDAPHPKAARAFLEFYMKNPNAHAAFSREMGYSTPSKAGQALLTPDEKIDLVSSPQQLAGIIQMDPAWIEANRASGLERWNRWISR